MTRIPQSMTTLRLAVAWIAEEDNPGDMESPDILSGYLTVNLAAYLFDVSPQEVANKVASYRKRHGIA